MKLVLHEKQQEVNDAWSFFFKPNEPTTWMAGQSVRLELQRPSWGISERRFTIASAPHEQLMQITTRISGSEFKGLLSSLTLGEEITAYNIEGSFTLEDNLKPALLIAGGIGITPFRAIITNLIHKNTLRDVVLIHQSRDTPAIFQAEMKSISQAQSKLSYFTLSSRLDIKHLKRATPDWLGREIYISGSSYMIKDISEILLESGAQKNQIKRDTFSGNIS